MNPFEILRYFEDGQERILAAICSIVDIESPSYNAQRSAEVADWVESEAHATGAGISIERTVVDDGIHIIIRAFPGEGAPTLLLGHTDTVHPLGTAARNATRIEGGKMYGCGIFDMKANVVLMFEALRYFAAHGTRPSRPITILLSCDEEVGSFTGRPLVEREGAKAAQCLVFEPSADGKLKTGRKGTGLFRLEAIGKPAHAGLEPEKGVNAISEISRQIEHIHAIANGSVGTTVNVTTIKGGTTTNVIPEHAECEADVRFATIAEAERVEDEFRSLKPFDERVRLEVNGGLNRMPLERTEDVVAFYERARKLAASFDYELGETQVGGASDGNFVAALGVPILDGLGITGGGAHMLTEHILLDDVAKRATLIALLLSAAH